MTASPQEPSRDGPGPAPTDHVLTVLPDGESIQVHPGETILQALYAAGFAYRTGCRKGGCTVCKADLVTGTVGYPVTVADSVLSADERATGTCLTCRAVPTSDVSIELREGRLRLTNPYRLDLRRPPDARPASQE